MAFGVHAGDGRHGADPSGVRHRRRDRAASGERAAGDEAAPGQGREAHRGAAAGDSPAERNDPAALGDEARGDSGPDTCRRGARRSRHGARAGRGGGGSTTGAAVRAMVTQPADPPRVGFARVLEPVVRLARGLRLVDDPRRAEPRARRPRPDPARLHTAQLRDRPRRRRRSVFPWRREPRVQAGREQRHACGARGGVPRDDVAALEPPGEGWAVPLRVRPA